MFVQHTCGSSDEEGLDGYSNGFRMCGKVINNLKYDDIVLAASSPAKLHELVSITDKAGEEFNILHRSVMKIR